MYKMRIWHHNGGHRVPFSLVYIFKREDLNVVRGAFETFIGFPAAHQLHIPWGTLRVHKVNGEEVSSADGKYTELGKIITDLTRVEAGWHLAVPILALNRNKKTKKNRRNQNINTRAVGSDPRELYGEQAPYEAPEDLPTQIAKLTAGDWGTWKSLKGEEPIPNPAYPRTAYLSTPQGIVAPVCDACPRFMLHATGKCVIGDDVCFSHLNTYVTKNQFFKKLRRYDQLEIEEVPDVRIQTGDARQD